MANQLKQEDINELLKAVQHLTLVSEALLTDRVFLKSMGAADLVSYSQSVYRSRTTIDRVTKALGLEFTVKNIP